MKYNPQELEIRWQAEWEKSGLFKAVEDLSKEKKLLCNIFLSRSYFGLGTDKCMQQGIEKSGTGQKVSGSQIQGSAG